MAITDGFANKSAVYEYDIYGKIKNKTGSFDNEITYTGRWLDEYTGLHYYRARWYDADSGRFISRDPIGTDGGINLYGYVGNNSINKVDPEGLFLIPAFMDIVNFLALYGDKILEAANTINTIPDAIMFYKENQRIERQRIYDEKMIYGKEQRGAVKLMYEGCLDICNLNKSKDECFDLESCKRDCLNAYIINLKEYGVYRSVDWLSSHASWNTR